MSDLRLDTLVELLGQYAEVYPTSVTGARGWVRAKRELRQTDPQIYIEWDKAHWRFRGEPDGWTFEHHFRVVSDTPEIDPDGPSITSVIEGAEERVGYERCPDCGQIHGEEGDYLDALMQAHEATLNADAFLIIALIPSEGDGRTTYTPEIYAHGLNRSAERLLESQMVHLASTFMTGRAVQWVNELPENQ